MRRFSSLLIGFAIFLIPHSLLPQNSSNLHLVAHINPAPGTTYSEVTGCGDLAIIGAFQNTSFVWIYDLADRANPALLSTIPAERRTLDVQVHGRYLFVSFDNGMKWYDILDPRQPKLVNNFRPAPGINAHTSFVSGNTLYIANQISQGVSIFDITDKKNPKLLADLLEPGLTIHDMTVIRGRMYAAWIFGQPGGLTIADVRTPSKPTVLAKIRYPQAATHNAWPTEDEQFILTTDEVSANPSRNNLKIWDARTPGQLTQIAEFTPTGAVARPIVHNVYVRGRYAYMSHYCEGVRIVDIANPANPQQVAFYDFNNNPQCYFNSNWGVDPFSNLIYASDMQQGLYVLEFDDHPAANLAGKVIDASTGAPVSGTVVYFLDEYPTSRTNAAGEFGIPWFKNDTVRLVTEAADYYPDTTVATTHTTEKTSLTIRLRRLSTGVKDAVDAPEDFALLPSYPNPFSSTLAASALRIVFRLPQPEHVRLEIFNTFGQRVHTLLNAPRKAGTHTIEWNGTDGAGHMLPAGIYFARLHAGKFSATRKIMMVR